MTNRTVRIEDADEPVARIVLDRPPLNVLTTAMLEELAEAIDSLAGRTDLKAVAIAAEGKAFSAGVDVHDHVDEKVRPMIAAFHGVFRRLADFESVTVAVVHGPALGGGCELAAFCDLVLASDAARFGQPEIDLALFPPIAAAAFPYFVNGKKTLELLLTGEAIEAREAERIGLANRVAPAEELDAGIAALRSDRRGHLAVAASLTIAEYLLPGWLVGLRTHQEGLGQPPTEFTMTATNSERVASMVSSGAVDLGFVEGPDAPQGLRHRLVGVDELV
ncbi:MAG: enoyl-CoA hydratase/isomerase family protein, partial [Gemmatimonadetes bacterium]|nr:enoyl-CoA hydratase/isomerase family protein [Gemmatimonadota bacterium]